MLGPKQPTTRPRRREPLSDLSFFKILEQFRVLGLRVANLGLNRRIEKDMDNEVETGVM